MSRVRIKLNCLTRGWCPEFCSLEVWGTFSFPLHPHDGIRSRVQFNIKTSHQRGPQYHQCFKMHRPQDDILSSFSFLPAQHLSFSHSSNLCPLSYKDFFSLRLNPLFPILVLFYSGIAAFASQAHSLIKRAERGDLITGELVKKY